MILLLETNLMEKRYLDLKEINMFHITNQFALPACRLPMLFEMKVTHKTVLWASFKTHEGKKRKKTFTETEMTLNEFFTRKKTGQTTTDQNRRCWLL